MWMLCKELNGAQSFLDDGVGPGGLNSRDVSIPRRNSNSEARSGATHGN